MPKHFLKNVIMRYLRIFFILGLLFTASALAESDYAGQWQGSVLIPGSPLEVVVTLSAEEGALSGTIDIPAQGAVGLPLRDITVSEADITFTVAGIPGDPTFRGILDGDTLHVDAGEFVTQLLPQQQGGFLIVSAPLVGTQVTFDEGGLQIRSPRGADTYTFSRNEL